MRPCCSSAPSGSCIATGIANIFHRHPGAMKQAQHTLAEQSGNRFLLGLGVSHAPMVAGVRKLDYSKPLTQMRDYLAGMAESMYMAPPPSRDAEDGARRARARRCSSWPAAPPTAPIRTGPRPEHTAIAREALGPDKMLCVEQKVVLCTDPTEARAAARQALGMYITLPNYFKNWFRLGYTEDDLADGGSDRLVDGLVPWGTAAQIEDRLAAHRDAGATHVCIQPLKPTAAPGDARLGRARGAGARLSRVRRTQGGAERLRCRTARPVGVLGRRSGGEPHLELGGAEIREPPETTGDPVGCADEGPGGRFERDGGALVDQVHERRDDADVDGPACTVECFLVGVDRLDRSRHLGIGRSLGEPAVAELWRPAAGRPATTHRSRSAGRRPARDGGRSIASPIRPVRNACADVVEDGVGDAPPSVVVDAEQLELAGDVAGAHAEDGPATRERVEGRPRLHHGRGMAVGRDVHVAEQMDVLGESCDPRQGGHRVVPGGAHRFDHARRGWRCGRRRRRSRTRCGRRPGRCASRSAGPAGLPRLGVVGALRLDGQLHADGQSAGGEEGSGHEAGA